MKRYEASGWKGDDMSLLGYLRKANDKDKPTRFIVEAFRREYHLGARDAVDEDHRPRTDVAGETSVVRREYHLGARDAVDEDHRPRTDVAGETSVVRGPSDVDAEMVFMGPVRGEGTPSRSNAKGPKPTSSERAGT